MRILRHAVVTILVLLLAAPAFAAATQPSKGNSLLQALQWRLIGPFRGGRSVAVAGVASEPYTFYFGGAGGGVWKTTDGGIHWRNISDKFFKTAPVGALAVAPSDPNVIYAGMGESFIRGDMITGDGIYKSTDAGKTWEHMGLTDTRVISEIVVDPKDSNSVYVAALGHVFGPNPQRGIYKSTNGGKTWEKVLYKNDQTGAADISIDPHNPRILFASLWQASRRPWMMSSGGPGSGLYKSTDGGETWTDISHNPGLPVGILGKIGVSVSGADPNRVYAIIEAKNGGVFRSDDDGATWQRLFHGSELTQRAWYYMRIYADPKNADVVYAPQVDGLFKSVDGGASFKPLDTPHGDNHVMWISPVNPQIMVEGNDGGATVSYDGGNSWSSEDNQPTAEIYHVTLDNQFPYHIYGAQQDNSTIDIASRGEGGGIGLRDWQPSAGGESGWVVPDPDNHCVVYGGGYSGLLERLNHCTQQVRLLDPWPNNPMGHAAANIKERFQWTYPILVPANEPHTIYVGSQYVLRSRDDGMSWQTISPDLTRNDKAKQAASGGPITKDNTSVEYYDTVFALAESPVKAGVLWAGSDDGLVHVSTDDGAHWQNVTPRGLPEWSTVSIIEPSHFDAGSAFLAAYRYRQDDFHPYLFKTSNYGKSWTRIDNGIPADEPSLVIRQDTRDPNLLFAGTQRSAYVSFDGGGRWQSLALNLPALQVSDMAIQSSADDLVIATHGRAFWVLDNLGVLRQLATAHAGETRLFASEPAYLLAGGGFGEGPGDNQGQNPANGAVIFYNLKSAPAKDAPATLTILDAQGHQIRRFSSATDASGKPVKAETGFYNQAKPQPGQLPAKAGMNRFVWDLRYPDATHVPGAVLWFGSMRGPKVLPGDYTLKLAVDGDTYTQRLTVVNDPRSKLSATDMAARQGLLMQIYAKLDQTDKAINGLRSLRSQIEDLENRYAKSAQAAALKNDAKPILDQLTGIEDALIQSKAHASEDVLNYPIRLNNKLAALMTSVEFSNSRPTAQAYAVFKELTEQTDAQLARWQDVSRHDLPALNQKIQALELPVIYLKPD
ncbi:MAG: glycosyl hydrolase [Gammaproteobacteria bacterium]|nr:glycosyl hydrolase [Gammaproteobacteria bacterium]